MSLLLAFDPYRGFGAHDPTSLIAIDVVRLSQGLSHAIRPQCQLSKTLSCNCRERSCRCAPSLDSGLAWKWRSIAYAAIMTYPPSFTAT